MKKYTPYILTLFSISLIVSCNVETTQQSVLTDPLPSWNDGETKTSILQFVEDVSDESKTSFVDIKERIAVFDNDGNLWSEKPLYFQLLFALDRIRQLADKHPEWKEEYPFKAILENDKEAIHSFGMKELLQIVMVSHAGNTTDEFTEIVEMWLDTAQHPTYHRPYTDLVYQPMLEVIRYLEENDFKIFIVSGGGIEFMRPWVEEIYGIPQDQVIGSSIKTAFEFEGEKPVIRRLPEIDFIDDKEGKPLAINTFIGRKPIFCSGNSDGDLPMMQWTASGEGKRFMMYLHHTDSLREWAYDKHSSVGRLDKGLTAASENDWSVIDMQKDWKIIYPFEKK